MESRKLFQSLLSIWILFLSITAFPSLSKAALASGDIQNTFIQKTFSWSSALAVKDGNTPNLLDKSNSKIFNSSSSIINIRWSYNCYSHIKKGIFYNPGFEENILILLNCQLLI